MFKLKQKKGITLIALVITIIVMLILVAVTITAAINGGLFDYARKAAVDTNTAIEDEQDLANIATGQDYEQLIAKYTTKKAKWTHTGTGTAVGDVYTTGGESFYVIDSDSETVTLLAAKCVNTNTNKQSDDYNRIAFDAGTGDGHPTNVYANATISGLVKSYFDALGAQVCVK